MSDIGWHPLYTGLERYLPRVGTPMTRVRKRQLVRVFESILELLYPDGAET